ncbi:unnamed protein product [Acanthocheilonema viteae]|uniref:Uncharacterized protein n=1 Tax=Acanthocheilonema viteae TaxID=6277 RepID=A0A498SMK6_ACAVI|nr:unnamed protein product [Acanthocheilonema viteae]
MSGNGNVMSNKLEMEVKEKKTGSAKSEHFSVIIGNSDSDSNSDRNRDVDDDDVGDDVGDDDDDDDDVSDNPKSLEQIQPNPMEFCDW